MTRRCTRVMTPGVVALVLAASVIVLRGREAVEIRVRGYYYSEPANVQITVAVEPDEQNRTLHVEADGESMFRSSDVTLTEDPDRRLYTVEFKNLPAGTYTLRAKVLSHNSVVAMAEQNLVVMGR